MPGIQQNIFNKVERQDINGDGLVGGGKSSTKGATMPGHAPQGESSTAGNPQVVDIDSHPQPRLPKARDDDGGAQIGSHGSRQGGGL